MTIILSKSHIASLIETTLLLHRLGVPVRSDYVQYLIDNEIYIYSIELRIFDSMTYHAFRAKGGDLLHQYSSWLESPVLDVSDEYLLGSSRRGSST